MNRKLYIIYSRPKERNEKFGENETRSNLTWYYLSE